MNTESLRFRRLPFVIRDPCIKFQISRTYLRRQRNKNIDRGEKKRICYILKISMSLQSETLYDFERIMGMVVTLPTVLREWPSLLSKPLVQYFILFYFHAVAPPPRQPPRKTPISTIWQFSGFFSLFFSQRYEELLVFQDKIYYFMKEKFQLVHLDRSEENGRIRADGFNSLSMH